MSRLGLLAVGVVLIAANGFFVAMEFALLAARRSRIEDAAEEGRFGAASALAGMRSLNVQLAACQLGITAMSLMLGWIVEPVLGGAVEGVLERTALPSGASTVIGLLIALTILSFVHMVAGEMVPKSVALAAPESTLLHLSPFHMAVAATLRPIVWVLNSLGMLGARMLRVEPAEELIQAHSPEEFKVMLGEAAAGGQLDATEADLLSGALGFLRVSVREVMTPRQDLVTVPATATVMQAEELLVESGHSRVLVTDGNDVIGFLHVKDLLRYEEISPTDLLPSGIVRVALRVDAQESLPDVLLKMRRARRHVAVVSEGTLPAVSGSTGSVSGSGPPDGSILGLVTMEDILEAIVGEITDESDKPAECTPEPGGRNGG